MRIIDTLVRDLHQEGTEAVYDTRNHTLDVSTYKFRPLAVTFSLQTDEQQLKSVLAYHQEREGVSRNHAYDFLLTEVSSSLMVYGDVPGPYVLDAHGRVAPIQ